MTSMEIPVIAIIFLLPILFIIAMGVAVMFTLIGIGVAKLCGVNVKPVMDKLLDMI